MTCESFRILASACRDGELESGEIISLGDHLKTCEACRARFESYGKIDDHLADLPFPMEDLNRAGDQAKTDLLKLYRTKVSRTSFWQRIIPRFQPAALAVAGLAAVFIIAAVNIAVWRDLERSLDKKLDKAVLDGKIQLLTVLTGTALTAPGANRPLSRLTTGWDFSYQPSSPVEPSGSFDRILENINQSTWDKVLDDVDTLRRHDAGLEGGDFI